MDKGMDLEYINGSTEIDTLECGITARRKALDCTTIQRVNFFKESGKEIRMDQEYIITKMEIEVSIDTQMIKKTVKEYIILKIVIFLKAIT